MMLPEKELRNLSKFLSLVLRHKPETIDIRLSNGGWVNTNLLIEKCNAFGKKIDLKTLKYLVETNNKKRFGFNTDKSKIRANQGHSVSIELGLSKRIPPEILYHGTAIQNVESILESGLNKQKRQHVHLSDNVETALQVGQRHGKPVVLKIYAKQMHQDGFAFFLSKNNVWLTELVPSKLIETI